MCLKLKLKLFFPFRKFIENIDCRVSIVELHSTFPFIIYHLVSNFLWYISKTIRIGYKSIAFLRVQVTCALYHRYVSTGIAAIGLDTSPVPTYTTWIRRVFSIFFYFFSCKSCFYYYYYLNMIYRIQNPETYSIRNMYFIHTYMHSTYTHTRLYTNKCIYLEKHVPVYYDRGHRLEYNLFTYTYIIHGNTYTHTHTHTYPHDDIVLNAPRTGRCRCTRRASRYRASRRKQVWQSIREGLLRRPTEFFHFPRTYYTSWNLLISGCGSLATYCKL